MNRPAHTRGGFTLVELLIVVMIIGIIGMVAIPAATSLRSPRLGTAANILASDLEFCQSECIHDPANLRVMQFNVTTNLYWMALASAPTTPVNHPADSMPYQNDFSTGRNATLAGVQLSTITPVPNTYPWLLAFDAYGKPQVAQDVAFRLTADGKQLTVTLSSATGDVTIGP